MNGYLMPYITRWQAGEKVGQLAREIGVAWQTLDIRAWDLRGANMNVLLNGDDDGWEAGEIH